MLLLASLHHNDPSLLFHSAANRHCHGKKRSYAALMHYAHMLLDTLENPPAKSAKQIAHSPVCGCRHAATQAGHHRTYSMDQPNHPIQYM